VNGADKRIVTLRGTIPCITYALRLILERTAVRNGIVENLKPIHTDAHVTAGASASSAGAASISPTGAAQNPAAAAAGASGAAATAAGAATSQSNSAEAKSLTNEPNQAAGPAPTTATTPIDPATNPDVSITLLVSASAVGALIGQAGATITQTREQTRANIKISSQTLENSTEKTVTVTGALSCVLDALTHILTQLLSNVIAAGAARGAGGALAALRPRIAYTPSASNSTIHPNGMLRNMGYPHQQQGLMHSPHTQAVAHIGAYGHQMGRQPRGGAGSIRQQHMHSVPHTNFLPAQNLAQPGSADPYRHPGLAAGGAPLTSYLFSDPNLMATAAAPHDHHAGEVETIQHVISIPEAYVGSLIGRRGSNISRIRSMTKCEIRIPSRTEGDFNGMRHITLIGTPADVMQATMQINQAISGASYTSPAVIAPAYNILQHPAPSDATVVANPAPNPVVNVNVAPTTATVPTVPTVPAVAADSVVLQ